jgi:cbb3-type cytochrome oxidase subunit 3
MFKEVFQSLDINWMGVAGMLLFLGSFLAVCVWAYTRSRRDVSRWSRLPLEDGAAPPAQPSDDR